LTICLVVLNCFYDVSNKHFTPRPDYLYLQFLLIGVPLFFAFMVGVGYVAVEPFARRYWPTLMVSWQRLLNGQVRDALVGRDILFGVLAGAISVSLLLGASAIGGISEAFSVAFGFGQGAWASLGTALWSISMAILAAMLYLALLTISTGIVRKKWLGIASTGVLLVAQASSPTAVNVASTAVFILIFMVVLLRLGLIASCCLLVVVFTLNGSPPLNFSQWYSGRAVIALLVPIALLIYGFWISLGGQSPFGNALREDEMR
jgi:hypothetical protein